MTSKKDRLNKQETCVYRLLCVNCCRDDCTNFEFEEKDVLKKPEKMHSIPMMLSERGRNNAIDEMDAYYKQFIKEYILDDISSAEVIFDYIMDAIEKRTTVEESANDLHKLIKERLRV